MLATQSIILGLALYWTFLYVLPFLIRTFVQKGEGIKLIDVGLFSFFWSCFYYLLKY